MPGHAQTSDGPRPDHNWRRGPRARFFRTGRILGCAPLAGRQAYSRLLSDLAPPSHRPDDSAGRVPGPRIIPPAGGAFGPRSSPAHPKWPGRPGQPRVARSSGSRWNSVASRNQLAAESARACPLASPVLKIPNGIGLPAHKGRFAPEHSLRRAIMALRTHYRADAATARSVASNAGHKPGSIRACGVSFDGGSASMRSSARAPCGAAGG
jgi:hypothetical protein